MKNFYTSIACLLVFLLAGLTAQANSIIVKGYVKYANGNAAANLPVTISTDSTSVSIACFQVHTKFTNPNGYYIDTLTCSSTISQIHILVPNCNGALLVENVNVANNTTGIVERNFTLACSPTPTNCLANFAFTKLSTHAPAVVAFNSGQSHGTSTTDTVIRRKWRFGNGDTLGGNQVNPVYTYTKAGSYPVCLTVFTAAGCENTFCQNVGSNRFGSPQLQG